MPLDSVSHSGRMGRPPHPALCPSRPTPWRVSIHSCLRHVEDSRPSRRFDTMGVLVSSGMSVHRLHTARSRASAVESSAESVQQQRHGF